MMTIIAVATAAATGGVVWGAVGKDVTRNAEDIVELRKSDVASANAGAVYAAVEKDVTRNADDIAELKESDALFVQGLQAQGVLLGEIRIEQGVGKTERGHLGDQMDRILRKLEKQWGVSAPVD